MARSDRRLRINTAACGIGLTLVVVWLQQLGALQHLRNWFYDRRAEDCQFFTPPPTNRIVHLDIDDAALEAVGAWPWPRSVLAELLDEVQLAGPKAVALDIIFSERQRAEIQKAAEQFVTVDHDGAMADSFRRLGNVLVPFSLTRSPELSRLELSVRQMLTDDLELTEPQVLAAARQKGFGGPQLEPQVNACFLKMRHEAARHRIGQAMDQGIASIDELRKKLLPHTDPSALQSPLLRALDEEFEQVRAGRELRRFGMPIPAGLPTLFHPETALFPLAVFTHEAAATAFVDYLPAEDGVVRSVPLLVEHDGKMYPQMGLMFAAMMLEVSPQDFRVTPDRIILPRPKGADGKVMNDLVVPVRTEHATTLNQDLPMFFDVPWVGTNDWARMYPDQPHRSVNTVLDVCRTRHKIEKTNMEADHAADFLLRLFDDEQRKLLMAAQIPADDFVHRLPRVEATLKVVDPFVPENTPIDSLDETNARVLRAANALRNWRKETPQLQTQLVNGRAVLKGIMHNNGVLVGWAATSMVADMKPTSIHGLAPGAVIHGTIANAFLTRDFWRRTSWPANLLVTFLAGLLATAATTFLVPYKALISAAVMAFGYFVVNGLLLFDYGDVLVEVAGPTVAIIAVWSGGTLTRQIIDSWERARITRRFGSYVDPKLVNYVLEHPEQPVFEGQVREMTVVFTDLEGFTELSEKLGERVVALLNEFMGMVATVIRENNGYLNKFLGDGVMFFFNAPDTNPDHARDAVRTILAIQDKLVEFNRSLLGRGLPTMALRAGVSTGNVVVGDAGSSERSDYTVLGNDVNLAARLESANKAMGTRNLITEKTIAECADCFLVRPVGRLCVVGMQAGVMTYEVLAMAGDATPQHKQLAALTRKVVQTFLDARPADCIEAIERMEEAFGASKLTSVYREKCERYLQDPSQGDFECQIALTTK